MNASLLGWIGVGGGFLAVAAYFAALAMRPMWVRVFNGSGLFFTGLGLMQVGILIRAAPLGENWFNANAAIVALLAAAAVQAYAGFRNRRGWDGAERRGSEGR